MYVIVHTWEPLNAKIYFNLFFFLTPAKGNSSDHFIAEAYADDVSLIPVSSVEGKD